MADMVELRSEDRDRLWEHNARHLRRWSEVLGTLIMLVGVIGVIGGIIVLAAGHPLQGLIGVGGGVMTIAWGGFILSLGRGIASLIEIAWYGLIDSRQPDQ